MTWVSESGVYQNILEVKAYHSTLERLPSYHPALQSGWRTSTAGRLRTWRQPNSRVKQMENRRPNQPHQTEWHWIPTAEPARRLIAPDIWRRSRRRGAKKHCSRGEPVFDQSQGPSEMSLPHVLLGIAEFREDVSGLLGPPKQDRQEAGIVPRSWQRARPLNCLSPASW